MRVLLGFVLLLTCSLSFAEIYKWKDSDGRTRYSDTPPPSNIKVESILGKNSKSVLPPSSSTENTQPAASRSAGSAKEDSAAQRAKERENQKKLEANRQAELQYRWESCEIARKNLAAYSSGGRLMTIDEKGERRYLSEDDLAKGKADAQAAVEKFCD